MPLRPGLKAKGGVESISSRGILGAEALDEILGSTASILGSLVGLTDVGELVADAVGDDVGVESLLLALGNKIIGGEEGTLISTATGAAKNKVHGGSAETKVSTGKVARTSVVVVVVLVVVLVVVAGVLGSGGSLDNLSKSDGSTASNVASVVVVVVAGVVVRTSTRTGISTSVGIGSCAIKTLEGEVAEAVGNGNISLAQTIGVERVVDRSRRVCVLDVRTGNSGVNKRDDATESLSGGEAGVRADGGDADGEGVEVLLGSHDSLGHGNDLGVVTKLSDDGVRKLELGTGVGTGKEDTGGLAGESSSLAGVAKVAEALDEVGDGLFLAEAGLSNGQHGRDESELGIHFDVCRFHK